MIKVEWIAQERDVPLYGTKKAGDVFSMEASLANEFEERGLIRRVPEKAAESAPADVKTNKPRKG